MRKWLQNKGDVVAGKVGQWLSGAKYHIRVNPILEGFDTARRVGDPLRDTFTVGNRTYRYRDIRDIAVQEGIFASFDTTALETAIRRSTDITERSYLEIKDAPEKIAWAQKKARDIGHEMTNFIAEIAETWSERERLGAMVTLMEHGLDPRTAARATIDALYDYAGTMTKWDRLWLVNMMFPFWAFQKNANRQIVNRLFSPYGAYRMGAIRRSQEIGAEALTTILYDYVAEPYGIDVESMPSELQDSYWAFRKSIEQGHGDLDMLPGASGGEEVLAGIEEVFGPVDDMDPQTREFLEKGFGGPHKVPPEIKQAMRMYFGNAVTTFGGHRERLSDGQKTFTAMGSLRTHIERFRPTGINPYYIPRPSPEGRRSYLRDRIGIAITPRMTETVRQWMDLTPDDHPYVEVFMPDSTINAGMRHVTSAVALMILTGHGLLSEFAKINGFDPDDGDAGLNKSAILNLLDQMGDPLGAPIPAVLLNQFTAEDGHPRRIHPLIRDMYGMVGAGGSFARVPGKQDPYAVPGEDDVRIGLPIEDVGRIEDERYYLSPGFESLAFSLHPIGEINDILLRWDKSPLEERMELQGEMLRWARVVLGLQTAVISSKKTATSERYRGATLPSFAPPPPK